MLDDYSPLRQLTPDAFVQEAVLFAVGRKARVYEQIGYYDAQGDNLTSPNPPMGALLTYFLRDDPGDARIVLSMADSAGRQVRQIDAAAKAGLHRTAWDLREPPPPAPTGQQGWAGSGGRGAATEDPPPGEERPPAAARGGRGPGGRARQGPLVKPGTYTVTLGKLVDGMVIPIAKPQTVEVIPLEPSNR